MNKPDVSTPTRQSVKGLVFIFLQSVRQAVRMFWALVVLFVVQKNMLEYTKLLFIGAIFLLILLVIHSILYYLNFYFYVKDGEFILKKGYLRKKVLNIPLERIQSVNTRQNLIQQVLDVVALEIDTAGTAGKELKIHALERSFASELSDLLGKEKSNSDSDNGTAETFETAKKEKLVLELLPTDLLKIGISQNHLRTGLIVIAFGFQLFNQIEDIFEERAKEYSNELAAFLSNSSVALITFLLIFFLMVSVFISLFRTLIKYYNFKLLKKEKAYRVEAGLLNKRNVVMPFRKIQELNWETGPIKKQFGIYNLVFKQAVSGQNKKNQLVDAPGCLELHLDVLKNDLFGKDELSENIRMFTNSYYFRRLWILSGWLPVLPFTPFFYAEWWFWLSAVSWLAASAGYCSLILKKSYFQVNSAQIRISSGAINHRWKQMQLYKIQAVEFKQTIFQKRRALASLVLMNASGTITIPYIEESVARQMYDYLLYHTETSEKEWM